MRSAQIVALFLTATLFYGCSDATSGRLIGKSGGSSASGDASGDSVSIDPPTMVGGGYISGYLACQFEAKTADDATTIGFKCRIENNGQKITLPLNSTVSHSVYDANNNKIEPKDVVLSPSENDPSSHWHGVIARDKIGNLRVETIIHYDGKTLARSTYVNDPPDSGGSETVQRGGTHLIGQNTTYIFGAVEDTPQCSNERKKGGDPAVLTEGNLTVLTLVFTAPKDTYIDVNLNHLCNVDDVGPVHLLKSGERKVLAKRSLEKRIELNDQKIFERFFLAAGRYELNIYANEEIGKRADKQFSLGDVLIVSSNSLDANIEVKTSVSFSKGNQGPDNSGPFK